MKTRLGLPSDRFLDRYTETVVEDYSRFPMVRLNMTNDETASCPFLGGQGCTIYEDRPAACRLYPLGRAATVAGPEKAPRQRFFMVDEAHCKGFLGESIWTIDAWIAHEGLERYNAINDPWLEVTTSSRSLGSGPELFKKFQMFFMVSYNLDRFRDFVFRSSFLNLFEVSKETRDSLASDDVALLTFGYEWLKWSLFGQETEAIKRHRARARPKEEMPGERSPLVSPS
jgi:hypothetical protein